MKKWYLVIMVLLFSIDNYAQDKSEAVNKIAFVILKDQKTNFIMIPNYGKYARFKIYRKTNTDDSLIYMTELTKPLLPKRTNISPFQVSWHDPEYLGRAIKYKIIAFDKFNKDLGEMNLIWQDEN